MIRKPLLSAMAIGLIYLISSCGGGDHKANDNHGHEHQHENGHVHDHENGDGHHHDAVDMQSKEYASAYICPMHCEGSGSDQPGTCPVCGMEYRENPDFETPVNGDTLM